MKLYRYAQIQLQKILLIKLIKPVLVYLLTRQWMFQLLSFCVRYVDNISETLKILVICEDFLGFITIYDQSSEIINKTVTQLHSSH